MEEFLDALLGLNEEKLNWWQMSIRAVIVFFVVIAYVRIGNKRVFGKYAAFDIVLGIIFGSIMSRAITGNAPFFPALLAGIVLILLHRALASFIYKTGPTVGDFFKGTSCELVKDGQILDDVMDQHNITKNDLIEAIRTKGEMPDISKVASAHLERSGSISVIMKK